MAKHLENDENEPSYLEMEWPSSFANHFTSLSDRHKILNEAYSDIVATSVLALVVYEEYLLNQTNSQELASAMSELRSSLPTDNTRSKQHAKFVRRLRRHKNGPRIGSKRRSHKKQGWTPPEIDVD